MLGVHNKKVLGDSRDVAEMEANEVLTAADGRAQDAIVTSLRSMFPGLRLVGEEGEVPALESATSLKEVPLLDHSFEVPHKLQESLTLADTCLWIDPLDGTKEFALGNLESVSVLIGVAVKDRPVAGIIHQPFVGEGDGVTTYGAVGVGVFGNGAKVTGDPPPETVLVMSPKTAEDPRIRFAVERLVPRPSVTLANACGNKLLHVLRGDASVFLIGAGPSRWDTCAGEALLMAAGGVMTTLDGAPYQYVEGGTYANTEGAIAARSRELHALLLEAFEAAEEPQSKQHRSAV